MYLHFTPLIKMNYLKHIQEDFFALVKVPEDERTVLARALERGILRVLQYTCLLLDHHQPDRFDQELQRYQPDSVQYNQSINQPFSSNYAQLILK